MSPDSIHHSCAHRLFRAARSPGVIDPVASSMRAGPALMRGESTTREAAAGFPPALAAAASCGFAGKAQTCAQLELIIIDRRSR